MTRRAAALLLIVVLLGGTTVSVLVGPKPLPEAEPSRLTPASSPASPVATTTTAAPPDPPAPPVPTPPPRDPMPACGVAAPELIERWIDQASAALVWHGEAPIVDRAAVRLIIAYESSNDPCAINLWDSNYYAGHPSKGLIQAIDPTFATHHLPGYADIYHPVDSIVAGVRYSRGRYGGESRVPGVLNVRAGFGYVGY